MFIFSIGCSSAGNSNGSNAPDPPPVPINNDPVASKTDLANDEVKGEPEFEGTAAATTKKATTTGTSILRGVRTGRHEGYDRLVFDFQDAELPTYRVEYVDNPVRACGSGDEVRLAGDGWLAVSFTNARAHTDEGQPTILDRARSPMLPVIKDLRITCDFEAEVTWVAGVSSPNKYRVMELKNPTRLVIDIRHE